MTPSTIAPAAVALPAAPASLGRRAGAYLIDLAIIYVLTILVVVVGIAIIRPGSVVGDTAVAFALLGLYGAVALVGIAWLVVYTLLQGGRGSIGQRLVKIRLVDAESGAPIGFWRALLRNIIWGLAAYVVVGYFSVLFDSSGRRQGWHDKIANAFVVDAASPAPHPASAVAASVAPPAPPAPPLPPPTFPSTFGPAPTAPSAPVVPPAPVASARPSAPAAAPTGMISSVPGVTIDPEGVAAASVAPRLSPPQVSTPAAPVAPAYAPPVPPRPQQPVASAGSPATGDIDLDETRAAPSPNPALLALVWDDGTRTAVYTRTLFGRNPGGEDGAVVASIRDETLSLSKTHFEVGPGPDGVYVMDRHSTNGTTLVRDGGRQQLAPGAATILRPGDVLEFGDRRATIGGGS